MWPKQRGLWVCALFNVKCLFLWGLFCFFTSTTLSLAPSLLNYLILLIYGHWALDQWPPWLSALIPYPGWSHAPALTATFPACISNRPFLTRFFFFSPLPQVETHSAPAYADTWLTVKCGVNLSTQACCLDTATVIKVTCDSDIIIRKKWDEGGKWTGVSSIFGYSHSIFSYT